jgi:hypothetical protein
MSHWDITNDPEHWWKRAEATRTAAENMFDRDSKDRMLRIAKEYEKLAERAEERLRGQ